MKKKKISLNKKLFLDKAVIASLNQRQQQLLAGGLRPKTMTCFTFLDTCETFPADAQICFACNTQ
jgi:hypothetical protein